MVHSERESDEADIDPIGTRPSRPRAQRRNNRSVGRRETIRAVQAAQASPADDRLQSARPAARLIEDQSSESIAPNVPLGGVKLCW
ncbi:MAG: hypothetical protein AB7U20_24025 [Planctomycetaceae bacterium]